MTTTPRKTRTAAPKPTIRLSAEQEKAVKDGSYVIDPVHGYVPAVPLTTKGEPAVDAPASNTPVPLQ